MIQLKSSQKLASLCCFGLLINAQENTCFAQAKRGAPKVAAQPAPVETAAEKSLITIAQAWKTNVLVDSTSLAASLTPDEIDPTTRGPQDNVVNVLGSCAQSYHLSSQKLSSGTFLFWPEPDQRQIALAVARGEGFGTEQGEITTAELGTRLFAQFPPVPAVDVAQGDNPAPVNVQLPRRNAQPPAPVMIQEFELSRLPTDLQQQVTAAFLNFKQDLAPRNYAELWLRPEVWQKARLLFRGEDPRRPGLSRTLLVQAILETEQGRFLLSMDTFEGFSGARALRATTPATPANAALGAANEPQPLRVFSLDETGADAKPALINDVLRPQGNALKSVKALEVGNPLHNLSAEAALAVKVSLEATRQPLRQFLAKAAELSKIALQLPEGDGTDKLLISARVEEMPLAELMDALAHLYGRNWNKTDATTFSFIASGRSPFEMELLRVGYMPWYKFRENNQSYRNKRQEVFYQLAAKIVDEAGAGIMSPEGAPFTALSPESQKAFREGVEKQLTREIVAQQVLSRHLLEGKWSFRLSSQPDDPRRPIGMSQLTLLIDGQRRLGVGLLIHGAASAHRAAQ